VQELPEGQRVTSLGVLFADLEKQRATSRAQSDAIRLIEVLKKGTLADDAVVIVVLCALVNKQDFPCKFITF